MGCCLVLSVLRLHVQAKQDVRREGIEVGGSSPRSFHAATFHLGD